MYVSWWSWRLMAAVITGVVIVVLIIGLAIGGGSDNEPGVPGSQAAIAASLQTVGPESPLIGKAAAWRGYPLPRPAWCGGGAAWVMRIVPGDQSVIVPTCSLDGLTLYLGIWPLDGCRHYPIGGQPPIKEGVVARGPGPIPDYDYYTAC